MADGFESYTERITKDLKRNIEQRKEVVQKFKINYLSGNNSKDITISRLNFEDLLDEFEFTISQSLQAIKSLEVENSNIKEMISIKHQNYEGKLRESENLIKEEGINTKYKVNDENELTNYQFFSPTNNNSTYINNFEEKNKKENTNSNVQYSSNLLSNRNNSSHSSNLAYNYNFEQNFDTSPGLEESNENVKIPSSNINNQKSDIYKRNTNLTSFRTTSTVTNSYNTNSTFNNSLKGLNLNYDYSNLQDFKNMLSINKQEPMMKFQTIDPDKIKKEYYQTNQRNNTNMIMNEKLIKIEDDNNNNSVNENNTVDFTFEMKDNLTTEQSMNNLIKNEDFADIPTIQINNFNSAMNRRDKIEIEAKAQTISHFDDKIEFNAQQPLKQGLRQKILKNKSTNPSGMNTASQNSPKNRSTGSSYTIDVHKQIYSENLDTESSIPYVKSKENAFTNRIQDIEKEILLENIVKRINRTDNSKSFLADKYSGGNYSLFLKKLKQNELDLDKIEKDLKFILNENEKNLNKIFKIPSENSNSNSNRPGLTHTNSAKNIKNAEYSYHTTREEREERPRTSYSTTQNTKNTQNRLYSNKKQTSFENENSATAYIEPVNFETFLRNSKNTNTNSSSKSPYQNRNSKTRTNSRSKHKN